MERRYIIQLHPSFDNVTGVNKTHVKSFMTSS